MKEPLKILVLLQTCTVDCIQIGYHYAIQTYILTSLIRYTEKPRSGKIWIAKVNGIRVGSIGIVENEKNQ